MIQINEAEYFGIKPIAPDWMKKRPQAFCESNNVGCGLTQTTYNTGIMGKRGKKYKDNVNYSYVRTPKNVSTDVDMCPDCGHALIWRMVGMKTARGS